MKRNIFRSFMVAAALLGMVGCSEDPFSEDYDIHFPQVTVTAVTPDSPVVGDTIKLVGSGFSSVTNVAIGAYSFPIVTEKSTDTEMYLVVPRVVVGGAFTITNKYKREYITLQVLKPQFIPLVKDDVSSWPKEIQKAKAFTLKGINLDQIASVKINGKTLSVSGAVTSTAVNYSTADLELEVGDKVVIEITPKNGEPFKSGEIDVVKASENYLPKQTIMLWDFETAPQTGAGWSEGSTFTAKVVDGFFGKAYEVAAAKGNAWNGCYIKLTNNNGGNGFDLSTYNKPYITFLVNTKGKMGYVNPAITIGGSESDKHFIGQGIFASDNYSIQTEGWEWRSYSLEEMGWDNIKGKVDEIDLWFRGGNVGADKEFYIMVDQVMITDGPLNPTVAWDAESKSTASTCDWNILATGSNSAFTGYNQGSFYASLTGTSTGWDSKLGKIAFSVPALDPTTYANGIWINFLVNTGSNQGYFQFDFGSGWMHLVKTQGYGDDYKLVPTENKWVWRSIKLAPGEGDLKDFDPTAAFSMGLQLYGGNIDKGAKVEANVDYFIFTTVPLDPNLNPSEVYE